MGGGKPAPKSTKNKAEQRCKDDEKASEPTKNPPRQKLNTQKIAKQDSLLPNSVIQMAQIVKAKTPGPMVSPNPKRFKRAKERRRRHRCEPKRRDPEETKRVKARIKHQSDLAAKLRKQASYEPRWETKLKKKLSDERLSKQDTFAAYGL